MLNFPCRVAGVSVLILLAVSLCGCPWDTQPSAGFTVKTRNRVIFGGAPEPSSPEPGVYVAGNWESDIGSATGLGVHASLPRPPSKRAVPMAPHAYASVAIRSSLGEFTANTLCYRVGMNEGRKRVILIAASIIAARRLADWNGVPAAPKQIAAIADSVRIAEKIMDHY